MEKGKWVMGCMETFPQLTANLSSVIDHSLSMNDNTIQCIEVFESIMYTNDKSLSDMNQARKILFCQKGKPS
jgi:hypothetical protein